MKNAKSVLSRILTHFSLIFVFGVLGPASSVSADSECITFADELQSTSPTPIGPFSGVATVTVGDEVKTANFIAVPLGAPIITEDGTLKLTFADLWIFEDGSMIFGINKAQGVPTGNPGELRVSGRITLTGGTGQYAGIFGKAGFQGFVQVFPDNTATASTSVKGRICGFGVSSTGDH